MLEFTEIQKNTPLKRDVLQRIKDFKEIYEVFSEKKASEQASRCMQCGDPYCHTKCPLGNYIPAWIKQVANKNYDLAFALSNEVSPFPEILGRICPQDSLCEGACSLKEDYGSVSIGAIETFISEYAFKKGSKPVANVKKINKKVAIVGSGPSGLSAATFLLRAGIDVEFFEKDDKPGGLLTYGIPNFKLDKNVVSKRVKWLEEAGAKFNLNCEIGKDISIEDLEENYDVIYLAIGARESNKLNCYNKDVKNVVLAIDFLTNIQKKNFGKEVNCIDIKNKIVTVVGGGDTAMDCVRTSIREGAKEVKCLYRRDLKNMPGSKKEVVNAKEEGVEFIFNVTPKDFVINNNKIENINVLKTKMVQDKFNQRAKVEVIPESSYNIKTDIVILALGFKPEKLNFMEKLGIDDKNRIIVDKNCKTSNEKIYAGGDCKRGANLAVNAALDGKKAAFAIIKKLKENEK